MKAIIITGSPRKNGNSNIVAERFAAQLAEHGIGSEVLQIGSMDIKGCKGCWACADNPGCVQKDDAFRDAAAKVYDADGIFVVAPVFYDSIPGQLKSFLDRLFFQDRSGGGMRGKVGAASVVLRRSGGVSALDNILHYMMCAGMIIAASEGESMVFGMEKGEALKDLEGLDIIDNLADNMAWIMKMKEATADTVPKPELKDRAQMNFIR